MLLVLLCGSCELFRSPLVPQCNPTGPKPDLQLVSTKAVTNCIQPDGALTVRAVTGNPPFRYSIESEKSNETGTFTMLQAGEYKVKVTDAGNCDGFLMVTVPTAVMSAQANTTPNDGCFSNSGTITVNTNYTVV